MYWSRKELCSFARALMLRNLFNLLLCLVCTIASGCDVSSAESPQILMSEATVAAIRVEVLQPKQSEIVEPIFVTGTVLAVKTTDIVPLVGGMVEEIMVRVGDRVKKGQALLRMRQRDFEIKVERLRQAVRLAAAEQRNARVDLENATALVKKGGLSQEQLDDRRTRYESTTAQRGIAQADLAEAELALTDATTRAPYDGVITQRNVDEGAFVSSFMRTSEPVMQIQKIDIMVAVIFVPEVHLGSIKLGTPGKITIPGLNKSYKSEVALINDRLDLQTRSIDVRLGIQNADYAIKPGLFIEVELYPDARGALTLPKDTIRGLGGDRYVFTVENGHAKRRSVDIRELENGQVEILSGIEESDMVIQGSSLNLIQDNARVTYGAPS